MSRYCASCGTEVDDTAVFCPTCGQPIDQAAEAEIPAAPAWPESSEPVIARDEPTRVEQRPMSDEPQPSHEPDPDPGSDEPGWSEPAAAAGWSEPAQPERREAVDPEPAAAPPPAATATPPVPPAERTPVELPITTPVMLSGWLIGIGALVGALGALIGLFEGAANPLDLILLLALLGVAATVFLVDRMPAIPNLRLATLVVALVGFGMALDRIAIGLAGAGELLLFLGTAAAGIGAILLELGRDQPLGGASS